MGRRPSHPQARLCGLLPVPTVRRKITWQVGPWRLPADGFPTASPDYPRLGPFSGRTFAAPRATSSPELGIGISCNGGRAMAQASSRKKAAGKMAGYHFSDDGFAGCGWCRTCPGAAIFDNPRDRQELWVADCGAEHAEAARTRKGSPRPRQRLVSAHPC
jgi:hypothetical protein